jgi:alpha-L-rhamnosidase
MKVHADGLEYNEIRRDLIPAGIVDFHNITNVQELLKNKAPWVSFQTANCARWEGTGSWALLDFGMEVCGGVRIVTRSVEGMAKFRLTFGESVSEACSAIGGQGNATNDHSPRDFVVDIPMMSDLEFGQTGFRFVRIELLSGNPVLMQSIFAVSYLPCFHREAKIRTSDELLNQIIETSGYTLKLNFQKGVIWDGIKRDRLVWCGDLHPEILTSLYLWGDTPNITNSLTFLKNETPVGKWINGIPAYSAWWVMNLCDYCIISGNQSYFNLNRDYAISILGNINDHIDEKGEMLFNEDQNEMAYFLDWSTFETEDSKTGVASLFLLAAKKFLCMEDNPICHEIIIKLNNYIDKQSKTKPVRAFQVLAGRCRPEDAEFLEEGGAHGFSTFMAYYILTALAKTGGTKMLEMLKCYYGGMLSRGATTFWEDFDLDWLENSGRIDELPKPGQKDLHADFGKCCYKNLRHSLCHGWSSGVLAFIIEYIIGVRIFDGGRKVQVNPHVTGIDWIEAELPLRDGELVVKIKNGEVTISAPDWVEILS